MIATISFSHYTDFTRGELVLKVVSLYFDVYCYSASFYLLLVFCFLTPSPKESVYLTLMVLSVPLFSYLRKVGDFFEDLDPTHSIARKLEILNPTSRQFNRCGRGC